MATKKTCPDCAESVLAAARVCKHCGYRFDSATTAPSTPAFLSPQGPPPPSHPYPAGPTEDHPQGTTILVLGILGIALCQVLAPIAWIMARNALRVIDAEPGRYRNRGSVQAGRVMGIIGTVMVGLAVLLGVLVLSTGGATKAASKAELCQSARRTLLIAREAYYTRNGRPPYSNWDLVRFGYLRDSDMSGYEIGPDGTIIGECTL